MLSLLFPEDINRYNDQSDDIYYVPVTTHANLMDSLVSLYGSYQYSKSTTTNSALDLRGDNPA